MALCMTHVPAGSKSSSQYRLRLSPFPLKKPREAIKKYSQISIALYPDRSSFVLFVQNSLQHLGVHPFMGANSAVLP